MAQRFGGRYSPGTSATGAAEKGQSPRPHPVGARVNLLFVLPVLFGMRAFFQDPTGLALNLIAAALLLLSAWLTREGVIAQAAYDARKIARRPALPRKVLGAVATGLGLGLAGLGAGIGAAVIFAALGAALHFASFGPDPMRDKGMEGIDTFQTDRAARAIADAQSLLDDMTSAIRRSRDRALIDRIDLFAANIGTLFRAVEDDPRQLNTARRYLGIYLQGARDATVKFADLQARAPDNQARADFIALLDDLEQRFALRRDALLEAGRTDLEIEIEVLRERLDREGLPREV
jgi:hypothetical protein